MAALPKKKHTRSRTGKRRGRKHLALPNIIICASCGKPKLSHIICPSCGVYGKK
ncbi:50S ribosomal protein L32 [Candidatus Microgenomates bacterium]|nr:50S ribosomal protein L32 [Candidatus Microgenomates bacterium]